MKHYRLLLVLSLIAIILPGCYWYETLSIRIDLTAKTGKVEFYNIVSIPDKKGQRWKKSDIQRDWNEFHKAFEENGLMDNKELQITSKELSSNKNVLKANVQFKYKDLEEIEIRKSADKKMYLMKKGPNDKVLETNGQTLMIDSVEYIGWDVNEKELFVRYQLLREDQKRYSLAPNYYKWKADKSKAKQ